MSARRATSRQAGRPAKARAVRRPVLVLKLGGELLEQPQDVARVASGIAALARTSKLVVVHGGGREIDAGLAVAGIPKRQVDGLRVTDGPTLDVVVSVLGGAINTRLVAAVRRAGGDAVGLTGADAGVAVVRRLKPITTVAGETVDLGLVGEPVAAGATGAPALLQHLVKGGYTPVVACVGATRTGELLNVNADTLASHLAVALGADRLVIAGGTSGVLDANGQTIPQLASRAAGRLIREGVANKGMVAKLEACRAALRAGVGDVIIANGRLVAFEALSDRNRTLDACTQVVS